MLKSILLSTIVATTVISLSGCTMTINAGNYNKELKDANVVFSSVDTRNVNVEDDDVKQITIATEDFSETNLNKIVDVFNNEEVSLAIRGIDNGSYSITIEGPISEEIKDDIKAYSSLVDTELFGDLTYFSKTSKFNADGTMGTEKGAASLTGQTLGMDEFGKEGDNFSSQEDLANINEIVKSDLSDVLVSIVSGNAQLNWNAPAINDEVITAADCKLKSAIAIQPIVREVGGQMSVNLYGVDGGPVDVSKVDAVKPIADIDLYGIDAADQGKYQNLMECGTTLNFVK
jgi:hypothetical protein